MIFGIMGAMPDEVDQLCAKLENVTVEPYGGVEYHKGTLAGKQVVVCCAGMGKANAAATTQVLITKFGAEKIIFSGIAGNMTSKIGIFRRGEDMESAVAELEDLLKKTYKVSVKDKAGNNPELVYAYRTRKMLKVALAIACGAAARKESRGAHFREDYPVRNDAEWLCRTIATWKNENDTLPTLSYEKLDVSKMELPPGWRGYGAKNYIDNPETPKRQAEVDAIRAKMEAEGADRYAIQDAIMPFHDLLPKRLQGKNERIDEPLA